MMHHGIQVGSIDRMVQVTSEWLRDLTDQLRVDDQGEAAYSVLRATLHAIRDRINVGEATDFGAQLPTIIRGIYYDGFSPGPEPKRMDRDEFLAYVANEANLTENDPFDAQEAVRAVARVLRAKITGGQIKDVLSQLPPDVAELLEG